MNNSIKNEEPHFNPSRNEDLYWNYNFSLFLHQDNLLWNRLQTIGVIQIGTLSAAYTLRSSSRCLSLCVLSFGILLTLLIFFLLKRDELIRRDIESRFGNIFYNVPKKWYALPGSKATWVLIIILLIADILFALEIAFKFLS